MQTWRRKPCVHPQCVLVVEEYTKRALQCVLVTYECTLLPYKCVLVTYEYTLLPYRCVLVTYKYTLLPYRCVLVNYEYTLQGTCCMLVNRADISALDSLCGFARGVSFLSHSPSLTTPSYEDFPSPFSPSQRADCPRHRTAHTETSLFHPRLYARLSRPTLCRHPHHTTRAKYRRTLRSALLSSGTNQPRSTLRSTRSTRTIAPRRSTLGHCCGL